MTTKPLALADFFVRNVLRCYHCDWILPRKSRCEQSGNYVVVECPKCHLMTPFRLEKSA